LEHGSAGSRIMEAKYNKSFQTGNLMRAESLMLAELYLALGDWEQVRLRVARENMFQSRTQSASGRITRETVARLKELNDSELRFLVSSNSADQGYLLWIAICRRYPFIAEFAIEVVREKYLKLQPSLSSDDFDAFFGRKSEWHPELENMKPASRSKWKHTLFRMLREADLLSPNGSIHPAILSPQLMQLLAKAGGRDIVFLPVFDADVRRIAQ
jgi:hypothetical protein